MDILIIIFFLIGYALITLEHTLNINKTATALLTGTLCWTLVVLSGHESDKILIEAYLPNSGIKDVSVKLVNPISNKIKNRNDHLEISAKINYEHAEIILKNKTEFQNSLQNNIQLKQIQSDLDELRNDLPKGTVLKAEIQPASVTIEEHLLHHISEIAGILFFLMGAMVIVELIDAHAGFRVITDSTKLKDKKKLLWAIGIFTFFLSPILDNLTTAIVMASIVRKLFPDWGDRKILSGVIIIAANAGGAWSPIGDVTTTMLWVGKQITASGVVSSLILPSIVCLLIPMIYLSFQVRGCINENTANIIESKEKIKGYKLFFFLGIGILILVPIFKTYTHLPPFVGMLLGLGIMWIISELYHRKSEEQLRTHLSVTRMLQLIDMPSLLFFLGILSAVSALSTMGILKNLATIVDTSIGDYKIFITIVGLCSAIFDNVPLVAAIQGMYDVNQYPAGSNLWNYLAYAAGTGGSILVIGSAAGIAIMTSMRLDFFWYLKKISLPALLGFLGGGIVYILFIS